MVRPPQSPDPNIIESVWDYMKRQKDLRKPTSTEDLCPRCLEQPTSQVPSTSVPRRIDAVLKANIEISLLVIHCILLIDENKL